MAFLPKYHSNRSTALHPHAGPYHQLLRGPLPRPSHHLCIPPTCSTHSTSELFKIQIKSRCLCLKVPAGVPVLLRQRMVPGHTCNGPCEAWPLSHLPVPPQSPHPCPAFCASATLASSRFPNSPLALLPQGLCTCRPLMLSQSPTSNTHV